MWAPPETEHLNLWFPALLVRCTLSVPPQTYKTGVFRGGGPAAHVSNKLLGEAYDVP